MRTGTWACLRDTFPPTTPSTGQSSRMPREHQMTGQINEVTENFWDLSHSSSQTGCYSIRCGCEAAGRGRPPLCFCWLEDRGTPSTQSLLLSNGRNQQWLHPLGIISSKHWEAAPERLGLAQGHTAIRGSASLPTPGRVWAGSTEWAPKPWPLDCTTKIVPWTTSRSDLMV